MLCDKSGRLGPLSYLVPEGMTVHPGDAVQVPFGQRTSHGMVLGPGDPAKATKAIEAVHGKRATGHDIALAANIAKFHFVDPATVLTRLAPPDGRGADPLVDDVLTLAPDLPPPPRIVPPAGTAARTLLVRAPLVDPAPLAAREAARLAATGGQVLILCPTAALVARVLGCFASGAQRLDSRAAAGAWKGFTLGTVTVGVGTRSAALYSAARLAGIVVVEEDHPGHLEPRQPHTHARDVASARSRAHRVPLTLISANPTPQALGAGVAVATAGTRSDWPRMRLIDRGVIDPLQRWAPTELLIALRAEQRAGRDPVILVQRKAAVRRCTHCALPRPCTQCDSSLCRHPEPGACPRCGQEAGARVVGWDAQRVSDLFGNKVRTVTLAELTELRDVGLVVIFDIDAALGLPELIPDTLATSVVLTAAQAAGAGGGGVIALTDDPTQQVLDDLFTRRDQAAVARRALAAARKAGLPPFGRLVRIRVGRKSPPKVDHLPGTVHGPTRVGNEWEVLVRIDSADLLQLAEPLARLRRPGKTRITVT